MKRKDAEMIHELLSVPDWENVCVLGCIDRRVTLYSQQVRALNLAAALVHLRRVKPGDHVVVVGAGAAGLTCAAGLHKLGAKVTVLEKQSEVLSLFAGNPNRWLHPRVYDWPTEGWDNERAGLPLLDWESGLVKDVREQLAWGWKEEAEQEEHINLRRKAGQVQIGTDYQESLRVVTYSEGKQRMRATAVILAVGFGLESGLEQANEKSYWDLDDIDVSSVDGKSVRWLVSGCGDGGLTDLFRLCLTDFRHNKMLDDFTKNPGMEDVQRAVLKIEDTPNLAGANLHDAYQNLDAPWVVDAMANRGRKNIHVTLAARTDNFLTAGASPLNRFLAGQLHKTKLFSVLIQGDVTITAEDGKIKAQFERGRVETYDRVVRRHGPESALEKGFPAIHLALQDVIKNRKRNPTVTDQSRTPLWSANEFNQEIQSPRTGTSVEKLSDERIEKQLEDLLQCSENIRDLVDPPVCKVLTDISNNESTQTYRGHRQEADGHKRTIDKTVATLYESGNYRTNQKCVQNLLKVAVNVFPWYDINGLWSEWLVLFCDHAYSALSAVESNLHVGYDPKTTVPAFNCQAVCLRMERNTSKANLVLKFCCKQWKNIGGALMAEVEANLSDLKRIGADLDAASEHAHKAQELAASGGDARSVARAREMNGQVYVARGDVDLAALLHYVSRVSWRNNGGRVRDYLRSLSHVLFSNALSEEPILVDEMYDEIVVIAQLLEDWVSQARAAGDKAMGGIQHARRLMTSMRQNNVDNTEQRALRTVTLGRIWEQAATDLSSAQETLRQLARSKGGPMQRYWAQYRIRYLMMLFGQTLMADNSSAEKDVLGQLLQKIPEPSTPENLESWINDLTPFDIKSCQMERYFRTEIGERASCEDLTNAANTVANFLKDRSTAKPGMLA